MSGSQITSMSKSEGYDAIDFFGKFRDEWCLVFQMRRKS
jgi:hypothetical protein